MDREDDIQYDGEVLPPEGAPLADYGPATPAVADDVLPDTLVLLPLPGRPFSPDRCSRSHSTLITGRRPWMRSRSKVLACWASLL